MKSEVTRWALDRGAEIESISQAGGEGWQQISRVELPRDQKPQQFKELGDTRLMISGSGSCVLQGVEAEPKRWAVRTGSSRFFPDLHSQISIAFPM